MSPRRHGSQVVVPSGARRETDQPSVSAVAMVAATSAASRVRCSSALAPSSWGTAPSSATAGPTGGASRCASSAVYSGCESSVYAINLPKARLTKSITGPAERKLRVSCTGCAPNASRARRNDAISARRKR